MKTWLEIELIRLLVMVIELATAFSMRCSDCGHLNIDQVNIFEISNKKKFFCECGNEKYSLVRRGSKYIEIRYYCIICDHEHNMVIPEGKFWSNQNYYTLECPNTGLDIGYYGSYILINKVIKQQQQELNSMANELGFDDFDNPEIMLEVLDYLHDLAAKGDLFCECGSRDIYIDLASQEIKLTCGNCNTSIIISASSQKDLNELRKLKLLKLKISSGNTNNSRDPWINI